MRLTVEQERYLELLYRKAESPGRPSPDVLDRIERIIGLRAHIGDVPPASASDGRPVTIRGIAEVVARHFGVPTSDLTGESRAEPLAVARHLAMRLARDLTGASYAQIGAVFNRNHSTVMYACRQVATMAVGDIMEAIEAEFAVVDGPLTATQ